MKPDLSAIRGDLVGGTTATLLMLPASIAFGSLVFSSFGPGYLSFGVVSGILALALSNLASAPFAGVRVLINGAYSLTALMLVSAAAVIIPRARELAGPSEGISLAIAFLFLTVFLSGIFQVLFGLLRIGHLVKYMPYPVIAGLLNGTAIKIILEQAGPMLGLRGTLTLASLGGIQFPTLLVGTVTALVILKGRKISERVPAHFLGAAAGMGIYYGIGLLGYGASLGPVIGEIPLSTPAPRFAPQFAGIFYDPALLRIVFELFPFAAGIAVLNSIRTLITGLAVDSIMYERSDSNRELIAQGIGNCVSSVFGGITTSGTTSRSRANYHYGGRTPLSRLFGGLFALAVLFLLGPAVSYVPQVVLAGLLVVLGIYAFDPWSLSLLRRLVRQGRISEDLTVVIIVTAIFVFIGIFEALGIGILIAVVTFMIRMGKDIVRRSYTARSVRSNVHRSREEFAVLDEQGEKIRVYELDGVLFFGTADKLSVIIDTVLNTGIQYLILDLRHVSRVDSTGSQVLLQIRARCMRNGITLLLSSVDIEDALGAYLRSAGILRKIGVSHCFRSLDDALARAEDMLLAAQLGEGRYASELPLRKVGPFETFTDEDIRVLGEYLSRLEYGAGDIVFNQGDEADSLYVLVMGRVDALIAVPKGNGSIRVGTISQGTIFGEMAFLDGKPRSASIVAESPIVCYRLLRDDFLRLSRQHPELSNRLLAGIGNELSMRMRMANRVATELRG